jgi:secondary thiamine-phosphate synthase enzyme
MVQNIEIQLPAYPRGFHLITDQIENVLPPLPNNGILHVFIRHSSAGLTINENADPSVRHDFENSFNQLVLENAPWYTHIYEGSDDMPAHLKSSITGSSVSIPIINHRLMLGTWQGIYLGEFRNHGGRRKLIATLIS